MIKTWAPLIWSTVLQVNRHFVKYIPLVFSECELVLSATQFKQQLSAIHF